MTDKAFAVKMRTLFYACGDIHKAALCLLCIPQKPKNN